MTNPDVEAAWAREVDVLARCAPAAAGIPAPVEVLDRLPGSPRVLPPTLYCKRRRAFFTAPCPTCGTPLADLRDDRVLESLGLPRRDRSLARFLACATCGTGTPVDALPGAGRRAERRGRRCAGSLPRLRAAGAPRRPRAAVPGLRARAHLLSRGGRRRVAASCSTPVTFYESRAIALPFAHLRWDEAMQLAGAASPAAVAGGATTEPGRAREIERLVPRLAAQAAHLFAHDVAGKLGLEVLRVKLALFAQLCRTTAALHRYTRAPHLGLTPTASW